MSSTRRYTGSDTRKKEDLYFTQAALWFLPGCDYTSQDKRYRDQSYHAIHQLLGPVLAAPRKYIYSRYGQPTDQAVQDVDTPPRPVTRVEEKCS